MTASPCIGVCTLDPTGNLCVGCLRTAGEIAAWPRLSGEQRAAVNGALPERHRRLSGGRATWAERRCAACGSAFGCGADDPQGGCWCVAYPPVEAVPGMTCLCPGCLAETVRRTARAPARG